MPEGFWTYEGLTTEDGELKGIFHSKVTDRRFGLDEGELSSMAESHRKTEGRIRRNTGDAPRNSNELIKGLKAIQEEKAAQNIPMDTAFVTASEERLQSFEQIHVNPGDNVFVIFHLASDNSKRAVGESGVAMLLDRLEAHRNEMPLPMRASIGKQSSEYRNALEAIQSKKLELGQELETEDVVSNKQERTAQVLTFPATSNDGPDV